MSRERAAVAKSPVVAVTGRPRSTRLRRLQVRLELALSELGAEECNYRPPGSGTGACATNNKKQNNDTNKCPFYQIYPHYRVYHIPSEIGADLGGTGRAHARQAVDPLKTCWAPPARLTNRAFPFLDLPSNAILAANCTLASLSLLFSPLAGRSSVASLHARPLLHTRRCAEAWAP